MNDPIRLKQNQRIEYNGQRKNAAILAIEMPDGRSLTVDPPRSRLVRAIWRWLGVEWTVRDV